VDPVCTLMTVVVWGQGGDIDERVRVGLVWG